MDEKTHRTIQALRNNKIAAQYYERPEEAVAALLGEISPDQTVGIGGSVTVSSLEIPKKLIDRGNRVFFHWLADTPEERLAIRRRAMQADVYLSSANALTEAGQLVNSDGTGNRVAGMIFGPPRVFIICGINKIVKDLDEALRRVKSAAAKNGRRLNLKTPCALTGKCNDCDSPQRMCNVTTIIEKKPGDTDLKVILIGAELGF